MKLAYTQYFIPRTSWRLWDNHITNWRSTWNFKLLKSGHIWTFFYMYFLYFTSNTILIASLFYCTIWWLPTRVRVRPLLHILLENIYWFAEQMWLLSPARDLHNLTQTGHLRGATAGGTLSCNLKCCMKPLLDPHILPQISHFNCWTSRVL